jgi:hypothetical protein
MRSARLRVWRSRGSCSPRVPRGDVLLAVVACASLATARG